MRRLPPMTSLAAFEATARLGSVTLAAEELGRSHGAVSKQIKSLSEAAGATLFEKAGTGLKLTPHGESFLVSVTYALDTLAESFLQLKNVNEQRLVLGISATFASRWLMPRLPRFRSMFPDLEIEFRMAGRLPALATRDADLILTWDRLRFSAGPDEGYEALGDVSFGLVCRPYYIVFSPEDQLHVPTRLVPDTNPQVWQVWSKLSGVTVSGDNDFVVPQTGLLIDAALNGMGVALIERRLIEAELQDERLVAPLGFQTIRDGFGAFVSEAGRSNPFTRPFLDWIRGEAA